jgi:hypothetical protein
MKLAFVSVLDHAIRLESNCGFEIIDMQYNDLTSPGHRPQP